VLSAIGLLCRYSMSTAQSTFEGLSHLCMKPYATVTSVVRIHQRAFNFAQCRRIHAYSSTTDGFSSIVVLLVVV
jgi:hypothetical protein